MSWHGDENAEYVSHFGASLVGCIGSLNIFSFPICGTNPVFSSENFVGYAERGW